MRQIILAAACVAALATLHVLTLPGPDRPGETALLSDPGKIAEIFQQVVVTAVAAVGMTLIIVRGGIDISIGAMLAVCGVAGATLYKAGWPAPAAVAAGMAIGAALGALNAGILLGLRIPPIIATLGTMSLLRGLLVPLGPREWIRDFPESFRALGTGMFWPPFILLTLVLLGELFARRTALGRSVYLAGSNEKAARVCGIDVWKTDLFVYTAAGALVGLSAMIYTARVGQVGTTDGLGFELEVIAAVVLGGTNIFGGEGTLYGSVLGALFFKLMTRLLVALHVPPQWEQAVTGGTILLVVGLDQVLRRLAAERARRAARTGNSTTTARI
jgi:ribose/xylose/arabinose/galactoside ABC-type transport system permease subunit